MRYLLIGLKKLQKISSVWVCFSTLLISPVEKARAARVVFMIGEQEYQTAETLPRFAREELVSQGLDCQFAIVNETDPNDFPGLNQLVDADLLVVSVRRRTPSTQQMGMVRQFIAQGGAVLGIRTASHAFDREPPSQSHVRWEHFDNEIFGADYQGHYGNKPPYDPRSHVVMTPLGREHPILDGFEVSEFRSTAHLYRNRDLAEGVEVLLNGKLVGGMDREPVAWTYRIPEGGGRSFYTSLGDPEDFEKRPFRRLLRNAVFWCLDQPAPDQLVKGAAPQWLSLPLTRRDPVTSEKETFVERVPGYRVGVVAIDMWNWHWCKTSTQRVGALVPRMNPVLDQVRRMGGQVFWCPTDVINSYNGLPQREIAVATEGMKLPELAEVQCPPARDGGGCTCGPEKCRGNFGWDGMHPSLKIHRDDLIPNDPEVLYALCRQKGITHLIYMGVHTQVCVLGKSVGVANMMKAGMRCILARDLTDAHGVYLPASKFTPDDLTQEVLEHFERHLIPTVDLGAAFAAMGMVNLEKLLEPVRMAPWGTEGRPHHFDESIQIALTFPRDPAVQVFYTLDGSHPTRLSQVYSGPVEINETSHLRAVAYTRSGEVSSVSEGHFFRRSAPPASPDLYLSEIEPSLVRGPGHSASSRDFRSEPFVRDLQWDQSNLGTPIRLGGREYSRGVGVQAVTQLIYDLEPRFRRFVALAGVDEEVIRRQNGSNIARHCSVVFRVFVDGRLRAESPVMRVGEMPWRFDVALPEGAQQLSLVATDAGDGTKGDFADWAQAGFVIAK